MSLEDHPIEILREIERLYKLLPREKQNGPRSPVYLELEARIWTLCQQFRAANEAIVRRWVEEGCPASDRSRRWIA